MKAVVFDIRSALSKNSDLTVGPQPLACGGKTIVTRSPSDAASLTPLLPRISHSPPPPLLLHFSPHASPPPLFPQSCSSSTPSALLLLHALPTHSSCALLLRTPPTHSPCTFLLRTPPKQRREQSRVQTSLMESNAYPTIVLCVKQLSA